MFNICAQNIDFGYTLEQPSRDGSNGYPRSVFWTIDKKSSIPLHTLVALKKWIVRAYTFYGHVFMMEVNS